MFNSSADELDVEQPGALPELFDSPDYKYFGGGNPFGGAMVMQAWSSYGIHWPLARGAIPWDQAGCSRKNFGGRARPARFLERALD